MSTVQHIPEWIQMAVNHALMKIIIKKLCQYTKEQVSQHN